MTDSSAQHHEDHCASREAQRPPSPSRRDLVRTGLVSGGLLALGVTTAASRRIASGSDGGTTPDGDRPFRVAHLTDMHVRPDDPSADAFARALRSLDRLDPPPGLVITGGDHVGDVFEVDSHAQAAAQWAAYRRALRDNAPRGVPIRAVLGNHDVFGWGNPSIRSDAPDYGKRMPVAQLEMPAAYYAFDAGGWHVVVLDSITRSRRDDGSPGYCGALGAEQLRWLAQDLDCAGRDVPVIVFSHMPLLSASVFFDGPRLDERGWDVPDDYMHRDTREVLDVMQTYNVRLLASGHMHHVDRVEYLGRTFICSGSVCGVRCAGFPPQFAAAYALFDLWPDGRFEHRFAALAEPAWPFTWPRRTGA